ncbi:predicted protein [Coccidioides posadasii str. Silveira]|uniref:Predicted protein n=2 Tax=Coccidioides posadasii TaxID=199306 RepID=E9CZK9_COCPS|nr:predicted protein [Coccidioides posadasii str. Silveira]KMM73321.1 hypothetical protein CPAG_09610 [Coccidioides posadasii RMSCC 3488]
MPTARRNATSPLGVYRCILEFSTGFHARSGAATDEMLKIVFSHVTGRDSCHWLIDKGHACKLDHRERKKHGTPMVLETFGCIPDDQGVVSRAPAQSERWTPEEKGIQ